TGTARSWSWPAGVTWPATGGTSPTATGAPVSCRTPPVTSATTSSPKPPTSRSAMPGSSPTRPMGRGTNVVVVRDRALRELLDGAIRDGRLALERVDADFIAETQAAGLRHRRE